jgi:hypothetical protein
MVLFPKWGMMAPDGRCKTFDAAADGFVRVAEGCAMIALKRLSDALAAGDDILAIIRGSAVNSDGRSSGLTVPNGPAQQAVVRRALEDATLESDALDYLEAHGTGAPLGHPIEVFSTLIICSSVNLARFICPSHQKLVASARSVMDGAGAAAKNRPSQAAKLDRAPTRLQCVAGAKTKSSR